MAIANFIPEFWVTQVEGKLRNAHVYGQRGIVNTNYEGQIQQAGDTVRINQWGEVSIGSYTRNVDLADPEILTDTQKTLVIDQTKSFHFYVDDLDQAQAHDDAFPDAMESAAYGLGDSVDDDLSNLMVTGAGIRPDPADLLGTDTFYKNVILPARTACARANLPTQGRFMIIPPEVTAVALDEDRLVVDSNVADIVNGYVGKIGGFTLLESNKVPQHVDDPNDTVVDPTTGYYQLSFGVSQATSFAAQISKVEAYSPEKRFGDAVKGLYVYGRKVLHPERLGMVEVNA